MTSAKASDMIFENHPSSFTVQGHCKPVHTTWSRAERTANIPPLVPDTSEPQSDSSVAWRQSDHINVSQGPPRSVNFDRAGQSCSEKASSMGGNTLDKLMSPAGLVRIPRSSSVRPSSPEDEPRTADIHRDLCTNCDKWIVTQHADGSSNNNWVEHASVCPAQSTLREATPSIAGEASTSISVTPAPTADSSEPKDTNTAFRRRKVKHYESERLALLQRDTQIEEVEEYRVLCSFCEKWIQLRRDRPYCPIAWTAHKLQCVNRRRKSDLASKRLKRNHSPTLASPPEISSPVSQTRRREEEERIQFLESDPHSTTVEPHRILCGICRRWIQLRKNSTYCTAPWAQHIKKCAAKHAVPRKASRSLIGYSIDDDGEDELESEAGALQMEERPKETPPKRGRGRPRKRKIGQSKPAFTLRPASPSPSNNQRTNARSSVSPPLPRTPSPPLDHPYSNDMYWYPALPPMSSYYPLYAGCQYNPLDDNYSLYFHAQPPAHQLGPTPGQGRFRAKPPKQMFLNPGNAPGSAVWHGPPPMPMPLPSGPAQVSNSSPGLDGSSPQPGRAWIVWRLKDYSSNPCPMDGSTAPDVHPASAPRESSEVSGSGSESLPMFRSGTWPHLMDPQDLNQPQSLSPYVHSEIPTGAKENDCESTSRSASFGLSRSLPPPPEDPALISFNSSAHIPISTGEPFLRHPRPQLPILPPLPPPPDPNIDPRFSMAPPPVGPIPPDAPTGADLDSPECRLAFTFQAIAYLFNTSFQGADDMSLDTLMSFMNRNILFEKMYDSEEVSQHVAILGERKQLVFTKEGGVQLLAVPP